MEQYYYNIKCSDFCFVDVKNQFVFFEVFFFQKQKTRFLKVYFFFFLVCSHFSSNHFKEVPQTQKHLTIYSFFLVKLTNLKKKFIQLHNCLNPSKEFFYFSRALLKDFNKVYCFCHINCITKAKKMSSKKKKNLKKKSVKQKKTWVQKNSVHG